MGVPQKRFTDTERCSTPLTLYDQSKLLTAQSSKTSLEERIVRSLHYVAKLMQTDDKYTPVFERLEAELKKCQSAKNAVERARAYLSKYD